MPCTVQLARHVGSAILLLLASANEARGQRVWSAGPAAYFALPGGIVRILDPTAADGPRITDSLHTDGRWIADAAFRSGAAPIVALALRGGAPGDALALVDAFSPFHPRLLPDSLGRIAGAYHAIAFADRLLLAVDASGGPLHIFDVWQGRPPRRVASWSPPVSVGPTQALVTRGRWAYLLGWNSSVVVLDLGPTLSDHSPPTVVGRLLLRRPPAYATAYEAGSRVLESLEPASLVVADATWGSLDGLRSAPTPGVVHVIDVSEPRRPWERATWQPRGSNVSRLFQIDGDWLIQREDGGHELADLSNTVKSTQTPRELKLPGLVLGVHHGVLLVAEGEESAVVRRVVVEGVARPPPR